LLGTIRERIRRRDRGTRLQSIALLAVMAMVLGACSNAPQSAMDPQGPYAQDPHDLIKVVFGLAAFIFVLVQGLIVYTVVKFRRKPEDDALPVQTHGNTKLEVFWTAVPALVLAVLAVPTVQMIFDLRAEPDSPDTMTVEVIGHRWWFEYRYPDLGIVTANELVIPVGRPVRLEMTSLEAGQASNAVIHSFWIPALAGKRDVVPGRINTLNLQADHAGRYLGQCAEFCGLSHANMRARAVALDPADWDLWVAGQQQPAATPAGGAEAAGAALFANTCVACHTIDGTNAAGIVGPDLTHLMSRREFAGAIFDLYLRDEAGNFTNQPNLALLADWVRCAPDLKAMRPTGENAVGMLCFEDVLSEADAANIAAYLATLR